MDETVGQHGFLFAATALIGLVVVRHVFYNNLIIYEQ